MRWWEKTQVQDEAQYSETFGTDNPKLVISDVHNSAKEEKFYLRPTPDNHHQLMDQELFKYIQPD